LSHSQTNQRVKVVITGGGTGGHLFAGVTIAREIMKRFGPESTYFFASLGEIEKRELPQTGIPFRLYGILPIKGKSILFQIKALFVALFNVFMIARDLYSIKPTAILGVGGFVSGPVIVAAYILKLFKLIPLQCITLLEQNAIPGLTNRWLSRFSDHIFLAFAGTQASFGPRLKTEVSGNPIRMEVRELAEKELKKDPKDSKKILIFGGSQGARGLNQRVLAFLPMLLKQHPTLDYLHQCGPKELESSRIAYLALGLDTKKLVPFISDMARAYRESDVIICRAGSSTLSELTFVGRPAILVPFPFAADNHQEKNARHFEQKGAVRVILESTTDPEVWCREISDLLTNEATREKMQQALACLRTPNAQDTIVNILTHPGG